MDTENIRVVICEDNDAIRELVSEYIKGTEGLTLAGEFAYARLAYEYLALHGADVLILDLIMPEIDGFMFMRQLGELQSKPKIIVTSAFFSNDAIKLAADLGANQFLAKPFSLTELLERIWLLSSSGPIDKADFLLCCAGFLKSHKGYEYVKQGAEIYRGAGKILISKDVYPKIAKDNDTGVANVEKDIRIASEYAYTHNKRGYERVFNTDCKLTNTELIGRLGEMI